MQQFIVTGMSCAACSARERETKINEISEVLKKALK